MRSGETLRGFTLIELMVALAILAIVVHVFLLEQDRTRAAADRAIRSEAAARVLDLELERARACRTARCLESLETRSATTAGSIPEAETWARALLRRAIEPGPDGTYRVTIGATIEGLSGERIAAALVRPEAPR